MKILQNKAEQFCHDILSLIDINRTKALVGIVMAVGSEVNASNPTNLSLSPFFQYHYPNPFTHEVNITLTSKVSKELTFSIVDVFGVIIYEDYQEAIPGHNTFTFNQLTNYPATRLSLCGL